MSATRPRIHDQPSVVEPELLRTIRDALNASHPLDLLELVSMMITALHPPEEPDLTDTDGRFVPRTPRS